LGQQNITPNQTRRNSASPHEKHLCAVSNSQIISSNVTSIGHIIGGSHIQYKLQCDRDRTTAESRLFHGHQHSSVWLECV